MDFLECRYFAVAQAAPATRAAAFGAGRLPHSLLLLSVPGVGRRTAG